MKLIRAVWRDIRRGKHIVDYPLILAAFVLPLLDFLKLVDTHWLNTAMLPILGLLAAKAVAVTWSDMADVQIHEKWGNHVYDAIAKAKKSIVILTTWVQDAEPIGDRIHDACCRTARKIEVEIFMLDPDEPFGPHRWSEVYPPRKDDDRNFADQYRDTFKWCIRRVSDRLTDCANVDLTFYRYKTMPYLTVCAIDDSTFFLSWLPINEPSTRNVCVELRVSSRNPAAMLVIDRLKNHINTVRNKSTRVTDGYSSGVI